jgi:trimethyllysine dioxygenase
MAVRPQVRKPSLVLSRFPSLTYKLFLAKDTEALARRIAFIRESHYGGFWEFTANLEHGDTAYTNIALGAHTDTTYFTDPVGLQLFQLLEHQGEGGQSLYVDGFNCAAQLKKRDPKAYHTLSTSLISSHSSGNKSTIIKPATPFHILNHHPVTKILYQIRWNNDDRDTLTHLSGAQIEEFYRALRVWMDIVKDSKNELWVKLIPGQVVVVDNWRVFHGRSSFTGLRRMCGGYIGRDDWSGRLLRLKRKDLKE